MAYCLRFTHNTKVPVKDRIIDPLSVSELKKTEFVPKFVHFLQNKYFNEEISFIKSRKLIKHKTISSLNPFLDESGILRVGGRLSHAVIPYEEKHPILLPSKNHIVFILLKHEHERLFHAGVQTV